eukprot:9507057-Lingulodinium_polyedra.AAC.1
MFHRHPARGEWTAQRTMCSGRMPVRGPPRLLRGFVCVEGSARLLWCSMRSRRRLGTMCNAVFNVRTAASAPLVAPTPNCLGPAASLMRCLASCTQPLRA